MAKNLTCPIPVNINPLSSNGFNFSISKLPSVSFFCQEVNLPGMSLPTVDIATPLSMMPFAGDILTYDDLTLQFLVDEDMSNYRAVYNWMVGLGFPDDNQQFSDFIRSQEGASRLSKEYSDGTLQILGSNFQPVKTVVFQDMLPTNLSSMVFQSTSTDVNYIIGNVTFKFNQYKFVD